MKFRPMIIAAVVALCAYIAAVERAVEVAANTPAAPEARW